MQHEAIARKEAESPIGRASLPEDVKEEWRQAYHLAYGTHEQKCALADSVVLHTPTIRSYEEAMALEPWHFILRESTPDGKTLRVVTRHGDKYLLPIPQSAGSAS